MNHDPKCPSYKNLYCQCALIAEVREDERANIIIQRAFNAAPPRIPTEADPDIALEFDMRNGWHKRH